MRSQASGAMVVSLRDEVVERERREVEGGVVVVERERENNGARVRVLGRTREKIGVAIFMNRE